MTAILRHPSAISDFNGSDKQLQLNTSNPRL